MSLKNVPIPEAAEKAGLTNLMFADDFDSYDTIDMSGEGKPGYIWYTDRPYGMPQTAPEEIEIEDSMVKLRRKPGYSGSLLLLQTYSKKGDTGYIMRPGTYMEAKIRAPYPTEDHKGWPAFWTIGLADFMSRKWDNVGELDIVELFRTTDKATGEKRPYFAGSLHDHFRVDGDPYKKKLATNSVNATGYNDEFIWVDEDWHVYAALWEEGRISWYFDNKLSHSATFNATDLPQYYHRDDPNPLPRIEHSRPELADRTWPGAHNIMNTDPEVLILGGGIGWPCDVDWVRVWQK